MVAADLIQQLQLQSHPEGGFFCRIYQSDQLTSVNYAQSPRHFTTAIHYLLQGEQFSCWHKIQSDELWFLSTHNSHVVIHEIVNDEIHTIQLTPTSPFYTVKAGRWFAAELLSKSDECFALCHCVVTPGFDFEDFRIATKDDLAKVKTPSSRLLKQ